ncbi:MAG TPA: M23 family metallopeptidase [Thermoanaerobaculia bacterium]|nr:M23 family metallopeptidase [Thermoanaerobaculia bacterium]
MPASLEAASRRGRPSASKRVRQEPTARIHQTGSGEVVLDAIEVVSREGQGPVLTAVVPIAHDHPQPPCASEDDVIEAHVHVADAETPEKLDAPAEVMPRRDSSHISRLARRVSSLFRPKSSASRVRPHQVDLSELLAENFLIPVEGVDRSKLRDSFLESRGEYARHLAIDIGAPRGTPILATTDGEIVRLTREHRGGITVYQKDDKGRYLFYYCHLSRYARGLRVGKAVSKGEVIGYVGSTGRTTGPHLHFSITRLPEDGDNLKAGLAVNPYLLFLAGVP